MSEIQLSTPARQALVGLLLLSGEATNKSLTENFSLEIKKPAREALEKQGLITAKKSANQAYLHTLTDAGWTRGRTELTAASPTNSGAVAWARLLYGALTILDRLMVEKNLTMSHVFSAPNVPTAPITPQSDGAPEDRVLAVYKKLAKRAGDLVSLVHLRDSLADIDRAELDHVLKAMDRQRTIQLEADPNRKALPPEAREASISIGGEDKHMITVGRS